MPMNVIKADSPNRTAFCMGMRHPGIRDASVEIFKLGSRPLKVILYNGRSGYRAGFQSVSNFATAEGIKPSDDFWLPCSAAALLKAIPMDEELMNSNDSFIGRGELIDFFDAAIFAERSVGAAHSLSYYQFNKAFFIRSPQPVLLFSDYLLSMHKPQPSLMRESEAESIDRSNILDWGTW